MKKLKVVSMVLAFVIALSLTSVLGVGCKKNKERIIIYHTSEEERAAVMETMLNEKFSNYEIILESLGTSEMYTRLLNEGENSDCDIVFDLESCNAQSLAKEGVLADLSSYDFSIYEDDLVSYTKGTDAHHYFAPDVKMNAAIIVNKALLQEKGLAVPQTHADLLKAEYKDLIKMPDPKKSGTGYSYYSGLAAYMGDAAAKAYFEALAVNVAEFTSSGSAPIKSVDKGEVAIGVTMMWQAVAYANNNSDLEVVILDNVSPYAVYTMGMVKGKDQRPAVKEVFDYIYSDVCEEIMNQTCPGKLYKEQDAPSITNWPTGFVDIRMDALYDSNRKQALLDAWTLTA